MKKLIFLLLISNFCFSQTNNEYPIPTMFQGIWTNPLGTDSIIITVDTVTWSDGNEPIVVIPDRMIDNTDTLFSFQSRPEAFRVGLKKTTRNKITVTIKTWDALGLLSRDYVRADRRQ